MYHSAIVDSKSCMEEDIQNIERKRRIQQARQHHDLMLRRYPNEILDSFQTTVVVTGSEKLTHKPNVWATKIILEPTGSVEALFNRAKGHCCILNFASFKRPGGGFLAGSLAQEESLCHSSTLYEVISKFENTFYQENLHYLNGSLYSNRMLYSPGIVFEQNAKRAKASVITCAAPNRAASKASSKENTECLSSRIHAMFTLAEVMKVDTFIVGAWGCGVFGQNPTEVAQLMQRRAKEFTGDTVVFAVPPGRSNNYQLFKMVLQQ